MNRDQGTRQRHRFTMILACMVFILSYVFAAPAFADDFYDDYHYDFFNIYTPNGTRIEVMQHLHHYDDAYWEHVTTKWDAEFAGLYLYRVAPASYEYNCHAYTFAGRRHTMPLDSLYWVNNCKTYLRDFSYQEVGIEDATIAVYHSQEETGIHSVCFYDSSTSDGQQVVTSKWGALPTYRHALFTDIYSTPDENPDIAATQYYRPWPDPWIIAQDTVLDMMDRRNIRRSVGSIVIGDGVTVTLAEHDTLMMHSGKTIDIYGTLILNNGACITNCISPAGYPPEWLADGDWERLTVHPGGTLIVQGDATVEHVTAFNVEIDGNVIHMHDTHVDEAVAEPFVLLPSYPNPFNDATTVSYSLEKNAHVQLAVYAGTGQKIVTLIDAWQDAGIHTARFDGAGLASGVYFTRLEAGGQMKTGKMLLLK